MSTNKYLHIDYRPFTTNWFLQIHTKLNQSKNVILQERKKYLNNDPLNEYQLAVSTKLAMLPQIINKIDQQLDYLGNQLQSDRNEIEECLKKNSAYIIPNENFVYEFLIHFDSFIFESRSTYEILGLFIIEFFKKILEIKINENELIKILNARNIDTRWIHGLREYRKYLFHETAPWIALNIKTFSPPDFELIIMKRNIKSFDNPEDFISFQEFIDIYNGFNSSLGEIHTWIFEQIEEKNLK